MSSPSSPRYVEAGIVQNNTVTVEETGKSYYHCTDDPIQHYNYFVNSVNVVLEDNGEKEGLRKYIIFSQLNSFTKCIQGSLHIFCQLLCCSLCIFLIIGAVAGIAFLIPLVLLFPFLIYYGVAIGIMDYNCLALGDWENIPYLIQIPGQYGIANKFFTIRFQNYTALEFISATEFERLRVFAASIGKVELKIMVYSATWKKNNYTNPIWKAHFFFFVLVVVYSLIMALLIYAATL